MKVSSNNDYKRQIKKAQRDMRGCPGGWKRAYRVLRIHARRNGVTWPVFQ